DLNLIGEGSLHPVVAPVAGATQHARQRGTPSREPVPTGVQLVHTDDLRAHTGLAPGEIGEPLCKHRLTRARVSVDERHRGSWTDWCERGEGHGRIRPSRMHRVRSAM